MARVLVAGCGRLGIAAGALFAAAGDEVFGLRRSAGSLPHGLQALRGDLADADGAPALPEGLEIVLYTAAADAADEAGYRRAYVDGPRHLLQWLAQQGQRPRRLLFVSSTAVYGQCAGEQVDEDSPTAPPTFRGRLLLEGERLVQGAAIAAVVLRLGGIYGPGRTWLVDQVRAGRAAASRAGAPQWTNRIHEADAAAALFHLARLPAPAALYLGVDCAPAPRDEVAAWLYARLGLAPPGAVDAPGPHDGSKRCANARLLASGFTCRYPTFRDGYGALLAGT
jgi:nucleoside-diphosphate-sugar epimerase